MIAPLAVVGHIHALLALAAGLHDGAVRFDDGPLEKRVRLLSPHGQPLAIDDVHQGVDVGSLEAPQEVAGGRRVRGALGLQAGAVQALGLGGHVVMDILRLEHGATLLVPLLLAQAVLDAPLAIAQPFLYPGLHLKYLRAEGMGERVTKAIPSERLGYFKFFCWPGPSAQGETLVLGLSRSPN